MGLGSLGSAPSKGDDGKGREPAGRKEATGNRGVIRANSVEPTRGESFLARNRSPDVLVPLQITIQSINFPPWPTGKEKSSQKEEGVWWKAYFCCIISS